MIPAWILNLVKAKWAKWLLTKAGKPVLNFILTRFFNGLKKGRSKLANWAKDKAYKLGWWVSEQGNKFAKKKKIPKFWEKYGEPFMHELIDEAQKGMYDQNG